MNDVGQLIRDANPIQGEPSLLADDELNALLLLAQTRSGNVDVQEVTKTVEPQKKRWNGWLIAAAAFAVVILFAGAAMLFAGPSSELPPATTPPTTQAAPTTTEAAVVEAAVVEEVEETTTTTTTLPFIRTGTYTVPDEVAPGTYRVWGSAAARLDENMELIEHYLAAVPGFAIMIVQPTDSFISVGDWIITVEDFGRPIDPIAEGLIDGVYLVGYDLEPGRYEVLPGDHPEDPYWARLDDEMEIIDSGSGAGIQEVIVEASDFALKFKGSLRLIP
jgi:hypothetical protein